MSRDENRRRQSPTYTVAQPGFAGGGTGGLGNGSPPAGSMAEHLVDGSGGHSLPKARSSY